MKTAEAVENNLTYGGVRFYASSIREIHHKIPFCQIYVLRILAGSRFVSDPTRPSNVRGFDLAVICFNLPGIKKREKKSTK